MEIVTDAKQIREIFARNGNHAEHNYNHYINMQRMLGKAVFACSGTCGVMGFLEKDTVWCYTDPLSPEKDKAKVFFDFMKWAFDNGAEKLRAEITQGLWRNITVNLPNGFRAVKPSFVYEWPVFDLAVWDPELSGTKWKKVRNIRNTFNNNHNVQTVGKENLSKSDITSLLDKWKKHRAGSDRAHTEHYAAAADSSFEGYDSVRFIVVDGELRAINGGWKIPNSNCFYSQLGLHDYAVDNMGEMMYIEDLSFLKSNGFDRADFGGSTSKMMDFKKKFYPAYTYKTIEFSIVPQE